MLVAREDFNVTFHELFLKPFYIAPYQLLVRNAMECKPRSLSDHNHSTPIDFVDCASIFPGGTANLRRFHSLSRLLSLSKREHVSPNSMKRKKKRERKQIALWEKRKCRCLEISPKSI